MIELFVEDDLLFKSIIKIKKKNWIFWKILIKFDKNFNGNNEILF